jgi:hypothetical protein
MMRTRMALAAAVAVAALAGCGSKAPASEQTIGPLNESLGIPGITIRGTAPATAPGATPTGVASLPPTDTSPGGSGSASAFPVPSGSTPSQPGNPSSGPSGGTAPSESSSAGRHGPVTVGFLTTATSNAGNYGATIGNTVSETGVDQALIDALNSHGGIDGRRIKVVFAHTDTGGSNWANEFQAACATFTQDHHVDVVLGYAFDYVASFESCLANKGIPHLSDSYNVPGEVSKYPLYWSLSTPPIRQIQLAKFTGAIKTGFLTPKNKLGVILDDCPGNQETWQSAVLPFLRAHHITVAPTFSLGCGTGQNAGTVASVGQLTNILLRFRSEGVDRISFQTAEGPVLLIGSIEAQSQGYRPGWIVSSLGGLALIGPQAPIPQMQNTHGYGWMPAQDIAPQYLPKPNAAQRRCLALLRSRNVHPRATADFVYAYQACEALFLYEKALKLDGGDSSGPAVSNAIAKVGSGFQSTLNLFGRSVYSPSRRNDAPTVYKPINWDGNCHCFRYGHLTFPMPS